MTTVGQAERHFTRGRGVYVCCCCGRRTRETTVQGSDNCEHCYELAGLQNAVWDGCFTDEDVPERDRLLEAAVSKGGDRARVQGAFPDLFAYGTEARS